ncbi:peptidoglycan recognition family protein [Actinoplanes sp. NPDC051851]|uniref:peptidoglycan recognition protein family protein n=1 Tax=Actinoplanes sp. NPDC051851 TaxID=3154753 RepID=UPI0034196AAE
MVSRRKLLAGATGLGGLGLAAAAGATAFAGEGTSAATGVRIPATLATRRPRIESSTRTNVADFTLTHLSVVSSAAAAVRLQTSAGWGDWVDLNSCAGGRDDVAAPTGKRSLILARDVTGYEVQTADGSAAAVTELNTVDGPAGALAAASSDRIPALGLATADCLLPAYLSRAAWGADESLRFSADGTTETWPAVYYPSQVFTVHHTGVYAHNDDPDPAATVRAVYYDDCVVDGYGDVGYQLLIDEQGVVYEGRVSGADGLPVFGPDPDADGRPQMTNGAHVGQFNAGNIGIVLLGRFTSIQPTDAAPESLVKVLALLAAAIDVDPAGRVTYLNPVNLKTGEVDVIQGHRDWNKIGAGATECPGDAFYPTLETVRADVAALLA